MRVLLNREGGTVAMVALLLVSTEVSPAILSANMLLEEDQTVVIEPLTQSEIEYLIGVAPASAFPVQRLSKEEMVSVNGRFGPVGAAVGAISGATAYLGGAIGTGDGNMRDFVVATVGSAAVGFVLGPTSQFGANAIVQGSLYFYAGLAAGLAMRGCSSCHAAYPVKTNWNVAPLVDSPPLFQKTAVFRPGEITP